jgi:hypothetical protein
VKLTRHIFPANLRLILEHGFCGFTTAPSIPDRSYWHHLSLNSWANFMM